MSSLISDSFGVADPSWHGLLEAAMTKMDETYLQSLAIQSDWLPGLHQLLAAFHLPLSETRYILLGESPYPRAESANGFAFWDNAVTSLWSESGLSKKVNRATSLRNMVKMFLVSRGDLKLDLSQPAIANLDKSPYISSASELFKAFMNRGFLLLNASLVYEKAKVPYHARQWRPFVYHLFSQLAELKQPPDLVLWGKIAEQIPKTSLKIALQTEHPYNLSFITHKATLDFFKPLDLLAIESSHDPKIDY